MLYLYIFLIVVFYIIPAILLMGEIIQELNYEGNVTIGDVLTAILFTIIALVPLINFIFVWFASISWISFDDVLWKNK